MIVRLRRAGMWSLVMALACGGSRPNAEPQMPVEPTSFSSTPCDGFRAALGMPDAEVKICRQLQTLPGVYMVGLKTSAAYLQRTVITRDGAPALETGPAAAARFLDGLGLDSRSPIEFDDLVWTLDDLKALPSGWDHNLAAGDVWGVGNMGITYTPFELTLIRRIDSGAGNAMRVFDRAQLRREGGAWTWILSHGTDQPIVWTERARTSLR